MNEASQVARRERDVLKSDGVQLAGARLTQGQVVQDVSLERPRIEFCTTELTPYGAPRPRLERVRLVRPTVRKSQIRTAVLTDVVLEGLDADTDSGFVNGCEFSRVTVVGDVGTLVLQMRTSFGEPWLEHLREVDRAASADEWSLDISRAVGEIEIRGYAARRIRRNPELHGVMTLESATSGRWRDVDLGDTMFTYAISDMLNHGWGDVVLVANPRMGDRYEKQLRALAELRAIGAVEPE